MEHVILSRKPSLKVSVPMLASQFLFVILYFHCISYRFCVASSWNIIFKASFRVFRSVCKVSLSRGRFRPPSSCTEALFGGL
jgi:hypothetical protein